MLNLFLIAALIIAIGLAIYTLMLWRKVWQQEKLLKQANQEQLQQIAESLLVIAKALLEGQVPWIEGCIRLKVLLDNYDHELSLKPEFQVLHHVFEQVKDTPSHEAWKALDLTTRHSYEQQFAELEKQYKAQSVEAVKSLAQAIRSKCQLA